MRVLYRGTKEYLEVPVASDVELDGTIEFSFDRQTWLTAEWTGDPGTTRTAQVLVDDDNLPAKSTSSVYVRFTDNPEIPLIKAGEITIR